MILGDESSSNKLIRRATQSDVDALLNICRKSFPKSLRWQSPRSLGRKWWDIVLALSSSETWVCSENREITGFCVLITDEDEEAKSGGQRNGSFFDRLFAVVTHPKLSFFKLQKKVRAIMSAVSNHSKPKVAHSRTENPIWLGLIAVTPHKRGTALAKHMLCFGENRASQLNRHVIKLRVDPDNKPAQSLYERVGFVCTSQTSVDCIYTKVLGCQTTQPCVDKS